MKFRNQLMSQRTLFIQCSRSYGLTIDQFHWSLNGSMVRHICHFIILAQRQSISRWNSFPYSKWYTVSRRSSRSKFMLIRRIIEVFWCDIISEDGAMVGSPSATYSSQTKVGCKPHSPPYLTQQLLIRLLRVRHLYWIPQTNTNAHWWLWGEP